MFSNKEDKNIIIMVIIILAVSLIALVIMLSIVWRTVGPNINLAITKFQEVASSFSFATSTGNSNTANLTEAEKKVYNTKLNYNFKIPNKSPNTVVEGSDQFFEEIYSDPNLGVNRLNSFNSSLSLEIPKIDLNSPISYKINSTEALRSGMYMHNASYNYDKGEMLFLCTRRFFNSDDPKSCYYLNLITLNDVIFFNIDGKRVEYKVIKLEYLAGNYADIYNNVSSNNSLIRIITTGKADQGRERLVITAQKQ